MAAELVSPSRLKIGNKEIEFPQRVKKFVEFKGLTIVLLKVSDFEEGDELVGRNIVAYDGQGELVWRIEYHGFKVKNRKGVEVPQAFFGLWIDKDGKTLRAGIPVAVFEVDPATGTFLKVELERW